MASSKRMRPTLGVHGAPFSIAPSRSRRRRLASSYFLLRDDSKYGRPSRLYLIQ